MIVSIEPGSFAVFDKDPDVLVYLFEEDGQNIISVKEPTCFSVPLFSLPIDSEMYLTDEINRRAEALKEALGRTGGTPHVEYELLIVTSHRYDNRLFLGLGLVPSVRQGEGLQEVTQILAKGTPVYYPWPLPPMEPSKDSENVGHLDEP